MAQRGARALRGRVLSDRAGYALVVYGIFVITTTGTLPTGILQNYAEAFGFSPAVLSLVAASTAFGVTIAALAFGNLSDRVGRKAVLLPGVLASAGALVLYFGIQSAAVFVAGRSLAGFAVGLFAGAGTAAMTELVGSGQTRRAATHAATASVAGFAVGPVIGGAFAEYLPWPRHLVYVVALAFILPVFAGVLCLRETVADREPFRLRFQRLVVPPRGRTTFGLAAALAVCSWMAASFFGALGAVMAIRLFEIDNRFYATFVVFFFLGASAAAQMGLRGLPIRRSAILGSTVLPAGFALIIGGLLTDRFSLFAAGALVGGIGQALTYLGGQSMVELVAPRESRGEIFTTYLVVVYVAGGGTAIGLGVAAREIGLEPAAIGYGAIVCALSIVTGLLSSRHRLPTRA